jgi:hypothetical protein
MTSKTLESHTAPAQPRAVTRWRAMCRRGLNAIAVCGALLFSTAHCGSSVGGIPDGYNGDARRGDSGVVMIDVPGDGWRDVTFRDIANARDSEFIEPPCPDAGSGVVREFNCDPLRNNGCAAGEGCYLSIEYPMGRCEREIYRADCAPAGTLAPGQPCRGGGDCTPGSVCFVTGAGTRCLRLCGLDGSGPDCPRGLVCEPTDTPGIGACN